MIGNEVKFCWELDYDLLENEGLFGEYLEMGKFYWYGENWSILMVYWVIF